jgi:hypothetical protein
MPTDEFRLGLAAILAGVRHGAADPGEVQATIARIDDADADAWVLEWTATAGEAWAAARSSDALSCYLRAATYYAAALRLIAFSGEEERRLDVWRRQRECWERVVDLAGGERLAVPYDGTTLPASFFAAPGGGQRPLVIMNNGRDATSQMWALGGAAAAARGYHWMTFDGPGQEAALYEQGLTARPDWEAVLGPVIDVAAARDDVDEERIAVVGTGDGGYLVPRALAFEHRPAAAVADPGIVGLAYGPRASELFSPAGAATVRHLGAPYGLADAPPSRLYEALCEYRLGSELAAVTTPLLVLEDGNGNGQSQLLYDRLRGPKALVRAAPEQREARILDWIGATLRDLAAR